MADTINKRKNIFYMRVKQTPQCMSCANMHIRFVGDVYHQFVWCKKQHKLIEKMPMLPDCQFYLSDYEILYGKEFFELPLEEIMKTK